MALKMKSKEELIETAKIIVDRQFPGEWEKFLEFDFLTLSINEYFLFMEDPDVDPDEQFENFKLGIFDSAKMIHEEDFF